MPFQLTQHNTRATQWTQRVLKYLATTLILIGLTGLSNSRTLAAYSIHLTTYGGEVMKYILFYLMMQGTPHLTTTEFDSKAACEKSKHTIDTTLTIQGYTRYTDYAMFCQGKGVTS